MHNHSIILFQTHHINKLCISNLKSRWFQSPALKKRPTPLPTVFPITHQTSITNTETYHLNTMSQTPQLTSTAARTSHTPHGSTIGRDQLLPLRLPTPGLFTAVQIDEIFSGSYEVRCSGVSRVSRTRSRPRPIYLPRETLVDGGPQVYWDGRTGEWREYSPPPSRVEAEYGFEKGIRGRLRELGAKVFGEVFGKRGEKAGLKRSVSAP